MRRIWLLVGLMLLPVASNAQSDSARLAAAEQRIAVLEQILGQAFLGLTSSELAARLTPANELPGGRYPYILSDYQLRIGLAEAVSGLQAQVNGALQRVAALEGNSGHNPITTLVVEKVRANRICIGEFDCSPNLSAPLQIRMNNGAQIAFESNLNHQQVQDTASHVGQINLAPDGGLRLQQNAADTPQGWRTYVNACREWVNFGPDSRGSLSYYRGSVNDVTCTPIPHDPTQDIVWSTDEAARQTMILIWRPNWSVATKTSSCIYCADKVYIQPQQ